MALFRMKPQYRKKDKVPQYYGYVPSNLYTARQDLSAGTVGDYALFAGGQYYSGGSRFVSSTVDVYNKVLTRSTGTSISEAKRYMSSANVGDYLLFIGGSNNYVSSSMIRKSVDFYNSSLTRTAANLSYIVATAATVSLNNHAIIAGGQSFRSTWYTISNVSAYDTSGTLTNLTALDNNVTAIGCTNINNIALFVNGMYSSGNQNSAKTFMESYNDSLTKTVHTASITDGSYNAKMLTVGNYALYAGGRISNTYINTVRAFNNSLTLLSNIASLSESRQKILGGVLSNHAIFAGGNTSNDTNNGSKTVDIYNKSLTKVNSTNLATGRQESSATVIDKYMLFAGGNYRVSSTDNALDTVEAYVA